MNKRLLLLLLLFSVCTIKLSFGQTYDNTFSAVLSAPSKINAMVKQPDGKIIIAGNFNTISPISGIPGYVSGHIARINTDGTVDNTFNAGIGFPIWANGIVLVYDMALQGDGKVIVVGSFSEFGGVTHKGIVRLNSNGTIDNTFDPGTAQNTDNLYSVAVQPSDGKIIVRGRFTSFNGTAAKGIVRLNTDGSVDNTFTASIETLNAYSRMPIIFQADGKIIIGGEISKVNNVSSPQIARLNSDGSLDAAFTANIGTSISVSTGPNPTINDIGLQSNGKIVIVGRFTQFNSTSTNADHIARLNTDGTLDTSFPTNQGFVSAITSLRILANDKIFVGGSYTVPTQRITRLNSDGSVDSGLSIGSGLSIVTGGADILDIIEQADNKVIVAGAFTKYNLSTPILSLARLNTNGSLDASYNPNPATTATITDAKVQSDGKLLICGDFLFVNGVYNTGFTRLKTDGSNDNTFVPAYFSEASVRTIGIQSTGKIIVGHQSGITRLTSTGAFDAVVSTTPTGSADGVYTIKVQADDKILIGGGFDLVAGNAKKNFARLNSDLTFDATFNSTNLYVNRVQKIDIRASDGKMILSEGLRGGGSTVPMVSLSDASGNKATAFDINSKFDDLYLYDAVFLPDGKILIGGSFKKFNGQAANKLVKVDDAGVRDNSFFNNSYDNYAIKSLLVSGNKIMVGKAPYQFSATAEDDNLFDVLNLNGNIIPDGLQINGDVNRILSIPSTTSYYLAGKIKKSGNVNTGSIVKINSVAAPDGVPTALNNVISYSPRKITLSWTDHATNESGFEIQRSTTTNGNYTFLAYTNADLTTYVDQSVSASTGYYYKVRAVNFGGESSFSNETNGITLPDPPSGPIGLVVNSSTESQIVIKWTDNSSNEDNFEIFRSINDNTNYSSLGLVSANQTQYTNTGLTPNTTYYYKVRAVNQGGASVFSGEVNRLIKISAPTQVNTTALGISKVKLVWDDASSIETGYNVYLRGTPNTLLTTLPANSTQYTVENLTPGTYYTFYVSAKDASSESSLTQSFQVQTPNVYFGEWDTPIITTPIPGRSNAISFVIGNKAYVGLGENGTGTLKDLWEFNPEGNAWTNKTDFPGNARIGAIAFTINGKGYVGTGNDFNGNGFLTDFYEYDPVANTWSRKADFPKDFNSNAGITSGAAFAIGSFGYVGLGNTGVNDTKAFYRYDPATDKWEAKASFPGEGRTGAAGFSINGKGFFAFGNGGLDPKRKDIWEYNTNDTWTKRSDFISDGRSYPAVFTINGEAFLCGGEQGDFFTSIPTNFVSQFLSSYNSWRAIGSFPGTARAAGVGFSIGSKGYLFSGVNGSTYYNELISYTPGSVFLPSSPASLVATYQSPTSVKLTWTDTSDNETQFIISLSQDGNSQSAVATLPSNSSEYTFNNLIPGSTYQFWISASNSFGQSETTYSNQVKLVPIPVAPSNLTGQALSTTSIQLAWTDNATTETGYNIYRSDDGSTFTKILTTLSNQVTYSDFNLNAGQEYTYKINAQGDNGESDFSNSIKVKTPDDVPSLPFSPDNFQVVSHTQTQVVLSWNDQSYNETGFEITRRIGNGDITSIAILNANATSFTDNTIQPAFSYQYFITSFNDVGKSPLQSVFIFISLELPENPSDLTADLVTTVPKVTLSWKDNSPFDEGFEIFRGDMNVPYATVLKDIHSFTDQNFTAEQLTYTYKVRSKNATGVSGFSNDVTVTFPSPPETPVTGVNEYDRIGLSASPNPIMNKLWIINRSKEVLQFKIVNTLGQDVAIDSISPNTEQEIDCEAWSSGLYIIQTSGTSNLRVVKK